jgi:predicted dehydrogenase
MGVKGVLHCSQICAGEENDINIRIYGEKGGLEWHQHEPNTLLVKQLGKPTEIYRAGGDKSYLGENAMAHVRTPGGHPEGYLEAFANIYRNVAKIIQAKLSGEVADPLTMDFPTVHDGVRGMRFIDAVIESGQKNAQWVKV